jgi:hypothetical protein
MTSERHYFEDKRPRRFSCSYYQTEYFSSSDPSVRHLTTVATKLSKQKYQVCNIIKFSATE